jgi:hypothetical protein
MAAAEPNWKNVVESAMHTRLGSDDQSATSLPRCFVFQHYKAYNLYQRKTNMRDSYSI